MITTNDKNIAEQIKVLRAHGSRRKYYNELIGYNSRLDELQAAVLRVKLKHLDKWNEARKNRARHYTQLLKETDLKLPAVLQEESHVFHLYIVGHHRREDIMKELKERGIGCGTYYPVPLHLQAAYRGMYERGSLPVAEKAAGETFALPLFPEMTDEQLSYVAEQLGEICQKL